MLSFASNGINRDRRPLISHARSTVSAQALVFLLLFALFAGGCGETPNTAVVLDSNYPVAAASQLVVYRANWQAVFFPDPIPPGSSSEPQSTVPASANTAYIVLAPGWDPTGSAAPSSLVVLQSLNGFAGDLNETLHIPVDDAAFAGNCAAGSFLAQAEADVITEFVFPSEFATLHYDAATCTTTPIGDAGAN